MVGPRITKTQRLIGYMRAGDWRRALSLANTFRMLGALTATPSVSRTSAVSIRTSIAASAAIRKPPSPPASRR
jgi:hypothetical protein